jgi:TRAP-type C4-dicarboxylate transport system permease small subunit
MRHLLDRFYAALMALAALALLGTFVCVMLGIIDRQVGWGLRGLDAYAGYGIAAALFLALPATLQKGEHIRVTLLLQRLPVAWRSGLEWWSLCPGAGARRHAGGLCLAPGLGVADHQRHLAGR